MSEALSLHEFVDPALMGTGFVLGFLGMLKFDHLNMMNGKVATERGILTVAAGGLSQLAESQRVIDPHASALATGVSLGVFMHTVLKYFVR